MKLYVYRLQGCKSCLSRQRQHNELSNILLKYNIEMIGVIFGMVDGQRVEPLPEHDQLCRKIDDPMKYHAPVYILESDDTIIKLPDMEEFPSVQQYAEEIINTLDNV